jgi:hypothetical protein
VFCGGDCGHEEGSFDFGSSAAGSAIGVGLAALIGMGRKACEGGQQIAFIAAGRLADDEQAGLSEAVKSDRACGALAIVWVRPPAASWMTIAVCRHRIR